MKYVNVIALAEILIDITVMAKMVKFKCVITSYHWRTEHDGIQPLVISQVNNYSVICQGLSRCNLCGITSVKMTSIKVSPTFLGSSAADVSLGYIAHPRSTSPE